MPFNYQEAFCRNIGLLTEEEQARLPSFTIAIPGMGGVGGAHLISLVRQGFQKFKIADMDDFELKNFNRQYGARMDTIGKQKATVMKADAQNINPLCTIDIFEHGINAANIDSFLDGVDLVIDALDAFVIDERRLLINTALERNIPIISAGPIGFSAAFLIFMPGGPTFDEYFAIRDSMNFKDRMLAFGIGLVPKMLQRHYMQRTNIDEKRGPSSVGAINLCAGVSVIYALKILLKKGNIKAVPHYHQIDLMEERYATGKLWFGNRGVLQRLKLKIAHRLLKD